MQHNNEWKLSFDEWTNEWMNEWVNECINDQNQSKQNFITRLRTKEYKDDYNINKQWDEVN